MPLINTAATREEELSTAFARLKVVAAENKKLFAFLDKWKKEIPRVPALFGIYNRRWGKYASYSDLRDAYQVESREVASILTEARAEGFALAPLVLVLAKAAASLGIGALGYLITKEVSSAVKAVAPRVPVVKAQAEKILAETKREIARGVKWATVAVVGLVALKIFKVIK